MKIRKTKRGYFEKQLKEKIKKESVYLMTSHQRLYSEIINRMTKPFINKGITKVASPEVKGLFYAPCIAYKLKLPFVTLLKKERLSRGDISESYKDYSKTKKILGIGKNTIKKGEKILLVDDIFESGKSGKASIKLIEKTGAKIKGISIIYNKLKKDDEGFFKKYDFNHLPNKLK